MAGPGNTIPKHPDQRRRRNPTIALTRLPAEGRKGRAPRWPLLPPKQVGLHERELELWRELWHTPQAVAWERLGWTHEVAQYARWRVVAEIGSLDAAKEARQLADRLGLTPLAMLRLRWEIAPDEIAEQRETPAAGVRERLRAVE